MWSKTNELHNILYVQDIRDVTVLSKSLKFSRRTFGSSLGPGIFTRWRVEEG
jgi:hypothetical protein